VPNGLNRTGRELAARPQLSAPEELDLSDESPATKALYGLDQPITEDFGRNCLIARRLLERGVRFVQVWSGADNGFPRRNWDSHEDIARDHGSMAASMDQPAAFGRIRWSAGRQTASSFRRSSSEIIASSRPNLARCLALRTRQSLSKSACIRSQALDGLSLFTDDVRLQLARITSISSVAALMAHIDHERI
jgi:hypothetical protein